MRKRKNKLGLVEKVTLKRTIKQTSENFINTGYNVTSEDLEKYLARNFAEKTVDLKGKKAILKNLSPTDYIDAQMRMIKTTDFTEDQLKNVMDFL
jgi:hypothetical protein